MARNWKETDVVRAYELTEELKQEAEKVFADDKDIPEFWKGKYKKELARNWDKFYKTNQANFFKDRNWLVKEFPELRGSVGGDDACSEVEYKHSDAKVDAPLSSSAETDNVVDSESTRLGNVGGSHRGHERRRFVVEVGCGVGNALLPILRRNSDITAVGFDCARRAIALFSHSWNSAQDEFLAAQSDDEIAVTATSDKCSLSASAEEDDSESGPAAEGEASLLANAESGEAASKEGAPGRRRPPKIEEFAPLKKKTWNGGELKHIFVWNLLEGQVKPEDCPLRQADIVLLLFVLSAIPPEHHSTFVQRAAEFVRPGGILLFRDYGKYDMAQVRFAKSKNAKVDENFYVRQDGTLAYYFEIEELKNLFGDAGMVEDSAELCLREFTNRKTEAKLKRVWIQARYRRPAT